MASRKTRRPVLRWRTYREGLDFYETHDETCDDVIQLNQEGPRWRNSHFGLRYSVHELGERSLRYSISDVDKGKRFEADANSEHWIYLVSTGDLPQTYALDFDYIPHTTFNEQLQVDFACESLAFRHRFILEFCEKVFYQTVQYGFFLGKGPWASAQVELHKPLHVRVEVVGNVFSFVLNGVCLLCVKDWFYRPRRDRSILLFWNGKTRERSYQKIDFEIRNFKVQVAADRSSMN